jgi:hypothetical protein
MYGNLSGNRKPRVALVRPSKLLWLPLTAITIGALLVFGTPHLRFQYSYVPPAATGTNRTYLSCDYIGWHTQRVIPTDGQCPMILFLRRPMELAHE